MSGEIELKRGPAIADIRWRCTHTPAAGSPLAGEKQADRKVSVRVHDSTAASWPRPAMKILSVATPLAPEQVVALAERKLRESPYFFLRELRCQFHDGVLTLRGRVPYRQLLKVAETIVGRVPGVEDIVNRVEVVDPMHGPNGAPVVRTAG
jgi:hypothetical protein